MPVFSHTVPPEPVPLFLLGAAGSDTSTYERLLDSTQIASRGPELRRLDEAQERARTDSNPYYVTRKDYGSESLLRGTVESMLVFASILVLRARLLEAQDPGYPAHPTDPAALCDHLPSGKLQSTHEFSVEDLAGKLIVLPYGRQLIRASIYDFCNLTHTP